MKILYKEMKTKFIDSPFNKIVLSVYILEYRVFSIIATTKQYTDDPYNAGDCAF